MRKKNDTSSYNNSNIRDSSSVTVTIRKTQRGKCIRELFLRLDRFLRLCNSRFLCETCSLPSLSSSSSCLDLRYLCVFSHQYDVLMMSFHHTSSCFHLFDPSSCLYVDSLCYYHYCYHYYHHHQIFHHACYVASQLSFRSKNQLLRISYHRLISYANDEVSSFLKHHYSYRCGCSNHFSSSSSSTYPPRRKQREYV